MVHFRKIACKFKKCKRSLISPKHFMITLELVKIVLIHNKRFTKSRGFFYQNILKL